MKRGDRTYGQAKRLLQKGLTFREIAATLDLSVDSVATWFRPADIARTGPAWLRHGPGDRMPNSAGRRCECGQPLSRWNDEAACYRCLPVEDRAAGLARIENQA